MQCGNSADVMEDFHHRELESFRSVTAFNELTVVAAMHFCAAEKICPPEWLVTKAVALMIELLKSQRITKPGRGLGYIAEYRRHLNDLDRWDAVQGIREIREKNRRERAVLRKYPVYRRKDRHSWLVPHHDKARAWLRQGTFECASIYLTGRDSRAGAAAVRASYRRIESKNRTKGFRSCVFDDDFLRKIGIQGLQDTKAGTKWRSLFDLTA